MPGPAASLLPADSPLGLQRFELGPFATNCYVLWPTAGTSGPVPCWIVDASFEPAPLIEFVRSGGLVPHRLLLTHAHVDHIAGLDELRRAFPGVRVAIHPAERAWPGDPMLNLSAAMGEPIAAATGELDDLNDGDELTLGGLSWDVRHTPGHSPGSVSLVCPAADVAVVGDALFAGSIGRTDFPGSDVETLAQSIRSKLYTLPRATRVFPGHGPATTIGRERDGNPFVRG